MRRASENFEFYTKMSNFFIYLSFFKFASLNKVCSLACLKAKIEEKLTKKIGLPVIFLRSKNILTIFGRKKKILNKF